VIFEQEVRLVGEHAGASGAVSDREGQFERRLLSETQGTEGLERIESALSVLQDLMLPPVEWIVSGKRGKEGLTSMRHR
jgi:hypothetical protein